MDNSCDYTQNDHDMISVITSATLVQMASNRFNELEFPQPTNYKYARLLWYASTGDLENLKSVLTTDIPDRIKTLALHQTISYGSYECCQELLDNGADPNGLDFDGETPLTAAASQLEISIAGLLNSYGAELELANRNGCKPLYLACETTVDNDSDYRLFRFRMADLLIGRGADVNGSDRYGNIPLHVAVAMANDIDLVKLLLKSGADLNRVDEYGFDPAQLAEKHCSVEIVNLLRSYRQQ